VIIGDTATYGWFDWGHPNENGGRTWWAQFGFTRIKTTPTILPKKIEEILEVTFMSESLNRSNCLHDVVPLLAA